MVQCSIQESAHLSRCLLISTMKTLLLLSAVLCGLPRTCSARKVKGILLVGNNSLSSHVELFDPNSGGTVLPIELGISWYCGGLHKMSDGRFLAIDSYGSGETFYLDLCANTVEDGPPLVRKRYVAASAWLGGSDGTVVVCGGITYTDPVTYLIKSCERLVGNHWVEAEGWDMSIGRADFAMATMPDGSVVATGGDLTVFGEILNNVAFLKDGIWTDGAPLRTAREGHAIHTSDEGVISVYGGSEDNYFFRSSEFNGDVSKKWEVGPSMIQERVDFDMAVYDGELYAIGGWDGAAGDAGDGDAGKACDSVEQFDTSLNKFVWAKHNLTAPRYGHCALAVDVECSTQ